MLQMHAIWILLKCAPPRTQIKFEFALGWGIPW